MKKIKIQSREERMITCLISNSQLNVLQSVEKGYWEHGCSINKAKAGEEIYIMPSKSERKKFGGAAFAVKGFITEIQKDIKGDSDWASDRIEDKQSEYVCRVFIDRISFVPLGDIEGLIPKCKNPRGVIYITV